MPPFKLTVLTLLAAGLTAGAAIAQNAPLQGDAARGKTLYSARCASCHVLNGPSFAGPRLIGVYGRRAGTSADFKATPGLAATGITWDEASLDAFLAEPGKVAAGTSMYANVPGAQDRADLIAYLKTLKEP